MTTMTSSPRSSTSTAPAPSATSSPSSSSSSSPSQPSPLASSPSPLPVALGFHLWNAWEEPTTGKVVIIVSNSSLPLMLPRISPGLVDGVLEENPIPCYCWNKEKQRIPDRMGAEEEEKEEVSETLHVRRRRSQRLAYG